MIHHSTLGTTGREDVSAGRRRCLQIMQSLDHLSSPHAFSAREVIPTSPLSALLLNLFLNKFASALFDVGRRGQVYSYAPTTFYETRGVFEPLLIHDVK